MQVHDVLVEPTYVNCFEIKILPIWLLFPAA